MIRRPPRSTRTDTLFPYTTLFRSDEHSLEVHAPFIQRVFPGAAIVPLLIGDAPPALVSDAVARVWGGPETIGVVPSDLSHFHAPPASEEPRVGQGCGSPGNSRWSPLQSTNN